MSDIIISSVGAVAGSGLTLKLLYDVLGPTAKDAGLWVREMANYRFHNLHNILGFAKELSEGTPEAFAAHPRVAHAIIDESSWLDDPVAQRYAAGLLASSRTAAGGDDAAVQYVNVLNRLTGLQTRMHHVIYAGLAAQYVPPADPTDDWRNTVIHLPVERTLEVLVGDKHRPLNDVLAAFGALERENLIKAGSYGTWDPQGAPGGGFIARSELEFVVQPTLAGLILWFWSHGLHASDPRYMNDVRPFDPPGPTV